MSKPIPYSHLSPEFIGRVEVRPGGWPGYREIRGFVRKTVEEPVRVEQHYPAMKRGKAVPWVLVEAMLKYAEEKWKWELNPKRDTLPAPPLGSADAYWIGPHWFPSMLTDQFEATDDMFVRDPSSEIPFAADVMMRTIGRMCATDPDEILSGDTLAMGARHMGISYEDYLAWVETIWSAQPQSLMFPMASVTRKRKQQRVKVGASQMISITEAFAMEFMKGNASFLDITTNDLQIPSKFVLLCMLGYPTEVEGVDMKQMTREHAKCMLYQVSYATRPAGCRPPVFIAIGGIPSHRIRLRRYGYKENGNHLPGEPHKPIMVLHHKKEFPVWVSRKRRFAFKYTLVMLELFRWVNHARWKSET